MQSISHHLRLLLAYALSILVFMVWHNVFPSSAVAEDQVCVTSPAPGYVEKKSAAAVLGKDVTIRVFELWSDGQPDLEEPYIAGVFNDAGCLYSFWPGPETWELPREEVDG